MKGLRIEGKSVGSRPPFKTGISRHGSQTSLAPSVVRRSGSVGNVAKHTTASTSGSPRNEPKQSNGHGHRLDERDIPRVKESRGVCKCQELNAKARILQEDYTNNLQQQIYYLELENSYLRQGTGQYWNPESKPRPQRDSYQRQSQASVRSHVSSHVSHPHVHLQRTYSEESLPEWPQRPILHHHEAEDKPAPSPSKHVDFRFHYNPQPKRHDSPTQKELDLLQKLDEASQREYRLEERLTKKSVECQNVLQEKEKLEEKINELLRQQEETTERNLSERRALMEENIDLQQRLDDLTPLIAQKESQIARMEGDVEQLSSKLRLANSQNKSLQMRLDDSKREEVLFSERDSDRQSEIDRLASRVADVTSELEKIRAKETSLIEEVSSLKRRLKEEELKYKKERTLNEKLSEENNFLIKENSKWSSELTRLELIVDQQTQQLANRKAVQATADEIAELKVVERSLRSEVSSLEERLRSEQERNELYESQLREREHHEEQSRESRNRIQKELEALQALSRSLNNENRGLREEKLALSEKLEILQKRLAEKEQEVSQVSDSLDELRMKYRDIHEQLDKQSVLQSEKSGTGLLFDESNAGFTTWQ
uniref:Myosin_tail_1 domain-containing protein n=1 Tax=Steinernema glaseri TaxID=37863 RepID=A0A1I7ZDG1_9BILA